MIGQGMSITAFNRAFDFFSNFNVARAADGNKATQGNHPN